MKSAFLPIFLLVGFLTGAVAQPTDEEILRESMATYWKDLTAKDFSKATEWILPEDLEAAKKELLPVFLAAMKSPKEDVRKMASGYFGDTPEDKRADLSPAAAYVCLNQFINSNMPQLFEILKTSTMTVDRVEVKDDQATVHYQIKVQEDVTVDTESFIKKDGKWWLRVKEDPKDTARKLRLSLQLEGAKAPEEKPAAEPSAVEP